MLSLNLTHVKFRIYHEIQSLMQNRHCNFHHWKLICYSFKMFLTELFKIILSQLQYLLFIIICLHDRKFCLFYNVLQNVTSANSCIFSWLSWRVISIFLTDSEITAFSIRAFKLLLYCRFHCSIIKSSSNIIM